MATPRVLANLSTSWAAVEGAAAGVAGVTWQNVGPGNLLIAFTTLAPAGGPTDAVHLLSKGQAYTDVSGSEKVWARAVDPVGAQLSATSE